MAPEVRPDPVTGACVGAPRNFGHIVSSPRVWSKPASACCRAIADNPPASALFRLSSWRRSTCRRGFCIGHSADPKPAGRPAARSCSASGRPRLRLHRSPVQTDAGEHFVNLGVGRQLANERQKIGVGRRGFPRLFLGLQEALLPFSQRPPFGLARAAQASRGFSGPLADRGIGGRGERFGGGRGCHARGLSMSAVGS